MQQFVQVLSRLQGAAGIRASTSFERIYDGVDSSLLDVHRLRHIIEPNMTVWHSGTTVNSASLPVYDPTVEALADGTIMRFGATQTLQTDAAFKLFATPSSGYTKHDELDVLV